MSHKIVRLTIENFQSHARTEMELSPGLTVIVGESDRGKSAVVRALRWLFFNEPRGTDFIRVGQGECRVAAEFADGTRLVRERSLTRNRNRYIILRPGQEPQVFEGFGSEVPQEVVALHGMRPVFLDEDQELVLNLAGQLEPPFLLSGPGNLKAKAIGRLHGVHLVDAALRDTLADLSRLQREEKQLEREIGELREKLAAYRDLPALGERLAKATGLFGRAEALQARRQALYELGQRLRRLWQEKERLRVLVAAMQGLEAALEKRRLLEEKAARYRRLQELRDRREQNLHFQAAARRRLHATAGVEDTLRRLSSLEQKVARLSLCRELSRRLGFLRGERAGLERVLSATATLSRAREGFERLAQLPLRLGELYRQRAHLLDVRDRLARGRRFLKEKEREVAEKAGQYAALLKELGRCPTCFAPVDRRTAERIAAHLAEGVKVGEG
ncbi:AAA family ATPase [Desulfovirgula thermocuniculi]|uniref:AAA family ATPase n=1 Tax=Desulfovirgula thermocuniculi TaxID=348842 RepID=UPI0004121FAD|nr:AAA family ATPase [Desulfovirgula thermocuniculi]